MRANSVSANIDVLSCVQYGRNYNKRDFNNSYIHFEDNISGNREANQTASVATSTRMRRSLYEKHKRQRVLKINLIKYTVIGIVLGILVFVMGIATNASTKGIPEEYKYYNSITVEYRQNMLDIAKEYRDPAHYATDAEYVAEVSQINNLSYDGNDYPEIHAGDYLIVPYYSAEVK